MNYFFIVLFGVHLIGSIFLYIKRREKYYLYLIFTFTLLVISFTLNIVAPEYEVFNFNLATSLKYISRTMFVISMLLLLKRKVLDKWLKKRKTAEAVN